MTRGVELTSLFDDLERAGRKPSTKVVEFKLVPADCEKTVEDTMLAARPDISNLCVNAACDKLRVTIQTNVARHIL